MQKIKPIHNSHILSPNIIIKTSLFLTLTDLFISFLSFHWCILSRGKKPSMDHVFTLKGRGCLESCLRSGVPLTDHSIMSLCLALAFSQKNFCKVDTVPLCHCPTTIRTSSLTTEAQRQFLCFPSFLSEEKSLFTKEQYKD